MSDRLISKAACLIALTMAAKPSLSHASMFGEETVVLMQVVANQITELQHLAEGIGIAKNHVQILYQINDGIQKVTSQIEALQAIVDRAQGVDPTSIRSLADVNRALDHMKAMSSDIQDLLVVKLILCNQAVEEADLQSDTAYKMGQELARTGAQLAAESKTASPGRAQQITASAATAQMLASGVELQTMAQMSQLLAMSLDLQKTQIERQLKADSEKRSYLKSALTGSRGDWTQTSRASQESRNKSRKGPTQRRHP